MKNINTIATLVLCAIIAFIIIRSCGKEEAVSSIEITEKIDTAVTEQFFTAAEVNKLIAVNIDSVDQYYKNNPVVKSKIKYEKVNVDSLYAEAKKYWSNLLNKEVEHGDFVYETGIDTSYVNYDSTDRVTDSIKVSASYYSRLPPDPNAFMSLNLIHKNYDYEKTITVKETVLKERAFSSALFGGAGYGLINKKFDVFIGYGLTLEFDLIKIIGGI